VLPPYSTSIFEDLPIQPVSTTTTPLQAAADGHTFMRLQRVNSIQGQRVVKEKHSGMVGGGGNRDSSTQVTDLPDTMMKHQQQDATVLELAGASSLVGPPLAFLLCPYQLL
jgi:hypothetical protein